MSHRLIALTIAVVVALAVTGAHGQTDLDGDGLYDIEDYAVDNGIDLGSVTYAWFLEQGIEDLDGASSLINAQELVLHFNAITSIESGDFSGLNSLLALLLPYNAITSIESGDFSGLGGLQILDLFENNITAIESGAFADLSNLHDLWLFGNAITSIESGSFADLGNLLQLRLHDNALTELNFTAANFPSLDTLSVDTAEITGLVLDDAILSGMSFSEILSETTNITDARLIGTDLGDTASLSPLLDLSLLGTLTVDAALYTAWQGDLDAWDALGGHVLIIWGELDGDGDVDANDIDTLIDNMGDPAYDLDGDGDTDVDDLIYMIEHLVQWSRPGDESGVGTERGDANLDGLVNATDLAIMKASFGDSGVGWSGANFNLDDLVNATDLAIMKASFGFEAPASAVPEPASMALIGLGGLAILRRRSR